MGKIHLMIFSLFLLASCDNKNISVNVPQLDGKNWAEKLGYPVDSKVVMLHADDIGMCSEANEAVIPYLLNDQIQSASAMVPCPWFNDIADWYKKHPEMDIGLHLTLTSEWKNYRWGPVSNPSSVPELIDPEGYLWRRVIDVASRTPVAIIEKEVRAQIERAYKRGIKPGHIDTHMGTLYSKVEYAEAFFNIAMEYGIPANVIEFTPDRVQKFRKQGYPITARLIESGRKYTLPKLDDFSSVPDGKTYQNKKENFFDLIQNMEPGITEIIFHPSINSEGLKKITNSWQQRVWESKMFSDPEVIQFLKNEGIIFTNWKEMMARFKQRTTK
ncbi:MAG: polysaccharide deacetylase family protein [Candidatus Neomarinimicrobiota bacterium]